MKIALLTEIPAPFRIPLFNALAARGDVDLRVLFLAREDPRRRHYRVYESEFAFDWRVLPGWELRRGGRWLVVNRGAGRELRSFDPDAVVVGGWNQPAFWAARSWARRRGRPLVTWVESTAEDARPGGALLERAKRAFVRSTTAFLVPGRASAAYVRSLGVEDGRIMVGPNAVDGSLFAKGRVDRSGRAGCTFLYVGRLDREKGLDVLFRALEGVPAELVVVGRGEDEERLRSLAPDGVRFTGPLERDALPAVYAEADAFVLPSLSEPWGMVLLEAAAAGLPLVATEAAGAAWEAIEEGENGFRVSAGDPDTLADALRRLAEEPALRQRMGERSSEIAGRFTADAWAASLVEAAAGAVKPK